MLSDNLRIAAGQLYRPVIFYLTEEQGSLLKNSKKQLAEKWTFRTANRYENRTSPTILSSRKKTIKSIIKSILKIFKRNHARRAAFIEENWRNEG